MRAPMIPGKKPEDNDQREAMLRRLGIAEEKPRTPSRWDVLARDLEPAPPVQTPPPLVDEVPVAEEPLPAHQPIPMTAEPLRTYQPPEPAAPSPEPDPVVIQAPIQPVAREPEPVIEAPVARAPELEPKSAAESSMDGASFMPGWGEESIPEDEEVEAFDDPEAPLEAAAPVEPVVHQPRWMDEPVAEAPRREELLPRMERPVGFTPAVAPIANDEDLDIPPAAQAETPASPPVMAARVEPEPVIEPPVARAPVVEPVAPVEPPVARQPVEPEPVVRQPVPEPVVEPEPVIRKPAPQPEPEPVVEAPVVRRQPAPVVEPEAEPEPTPVARRQAAPAPEPAAPPVDAALQEMRAELEAMRKQFQTAPQPQPQPQPSAPIAAAIPYDGRRKSKQDFFANARMVIWTLGIVAALWVTFHALQASSHHPTKQDHILASVTGKEKADASDKADQNNDN